MPSLAPVLTAPLTRYAARLHSAILADSAARGGSAHHVASPLGGWLLLGLAARAGRLVPGSAAGEALATALGCPLEHAATLTERLLADPPDAVHAAAAGWLAEAVRAPGIRDFLAGLPCSTGGLPTQAEADAWAREHTGGLIDAFPADLDDPRLLLMLATVVATRVAWQVPFTVAPAADLGPGAFAGRLDRALRAAPQRWVIGHDLQILRTAHGPMAVHCALASSGLDVLSVIADPALPPAQVLEAAYEVAGLSAQRIAERRLSLFDLPLGDGPGWAITERREMSAGPARQEHWVDVTLPAWSARSRHALTELGADLGFEAAGQLLGPLLGRPTLPATAVQAAVARYHRRGFEAAALTAMPLAGAAALVPGQVTIRAARLRFGHPYAVVARARDVADTWVPDDAAHPWHRVPVFAAWVSEVEEPQD